MRIRSIALVHEKLYENDNLSKIEARSYIPELVQVIVDSHTTKQKSIDFKTDIDDIELSLDQGIPCGLILNELISNSFKHAFTNRTTGTIHVQLNENGETIDLFVSDNGVGLPDDFEIGKSNSLGLILIQTLSAQIKADLDIQSDETGTSFHLNFKKESIKVPEPSSVYS